MTGDSAVKKRIKTEARPKKFSKKKVRKSKPRKP
jgi:hypothetical protein